MYRDKIQLVLDALSPTNHGSAEIIRVACAIDGFLIRQLTVSQAAEVAGITEEQFVERLRHRHISFLVEEKSLPPEVSVVLPVFNEEQNIAEIHRRLVDVFASITGDYELVFVDDGSTDSSGVIIRKLAESFGHIKLVELSRNFGHQAAISAGMNHCDGRAIVLMDCDLQDPPELISKMLATWRTGAEVVFGVRRRRDEWLPKRTAYFVFYRLLKLIADIDVPLDSGDFCLLDRKVVAHLNALPERNRFLRGLRAWVGFKQIPLYYERHPRHAGRPKYGFRTLVKLALDGVFSFSTVPLRLAVYLGFLVCLAGIGYLGFAVISHYINQRVPVGWTSTVALILLIGGTQLVLLGIVGEYIARIYDESKKRPSYIVKSLYSKSNSTDVL